MNTWIVELNAFTQGWLAILCRASWQGGLAVLLVWGITRTPTRLPARVKVWLWRLAYFKLLVAFFWAAPMDLALLPAPRMAVATAARAEETTPGALPPRLASNRPHPATETHALPSLSSWLFLLWLLGLLTGSGRFFGHWRRANSLRRNARPVNDAALNQEYSALAATFGIKTPPVLFETPFASVPLLAGTLRPFILLPTAVVQRFPPEQLRFILAHELAHLKRRDLAWMKVVWLAETLFFFHPLLWLTRREWHLASEVACDELVLQATRGAASDYGTMLLDVIARSLRDLPAQSVLGVGIIETRKTLERRLIAMNTLNVSSPPRIALALFTLLLLGTIGILPWRIVAQNPPKEKDATARQPAQAGPKFEAQSSVKPEREGLSFTGGVIDKRTGKSIQGATVTVRRMIYSATEDRVLEETKHETDAEGRFRFSLRPEQAANRYAYLEFEVTHPNYAPHVPDGYSLSMIRKNEALGERPFFQRLEMEPAESIIGKLVKPDGAPAEGVKLLGFSKARKDDMAEYGSFVKGQSDAAGLFRLNVVKGGEAVLWLLPDDFVPSTHLLHQLRGDLGRFVLEGGIRLNGRVLDREGRPVKQVWINADLSGGPAQKDIGMPVADALGRSALTGENGEFAMAPLPAGDYDLLVTEYPRYRTKGDSTRYSVPDVFLHQKLSLEPGKAVQSVEVRAVPHVVLEIQQLDSSGKPRKTHEVHASGMFGDTNWWGDGQPDENGKILLKAPTGLTDTRIQILKNEHQASRYRWSKESALRNEDEIRAGTLKKDRSEISIVYYTAPVLLVRAVAADGSAIPGFRCQVVYGNVRKPHREAPHWSNGLEGDVNFEKQQDGRWRTQGLLPDESFLLTVEAEGLRAWSQRLSLPEGATKEVEAKLEKQ